MDSAFFEELEELIETYLNQNGYEDSEIIEDLERKLRELKGETE